MIKCHTGRHQLCVYSAVLSAGGGKIVPLLHPAKKTKNNFFSEKG